MHQATYEVWIIDGTYANKFAELQITLWAISKSPLFSGGDLRYLDARTLDLLTNSVLLDMNARSTRNQEVLLAVNDFEILVDVLHFWHP